MKLNPKKMTPMPGYVLVEPAKAKEKTVGGIYLPDNHDEKPLYGTVLSVGADWETEEGATLKSPVKPNDKVVYKKWGGNEVKIGDVEYQFLKFEDILATITK